MPKALVIYATRSGQTESTADFVAKGIRFTGMEARVVNATADNRGASAGFESGAPPGNGMFACRQKHGVPGFDPEDNVAL